MKRLLCPSSSIVFWVPLILFIFVTVPGSLCADDRRFTNCHDVAVSCGELTNIKYPFSGLDRQDYCAGRPGLEVICESNIPKVNISSVKYRILDWKQEQKNLTIARDDYWDSLCPNASENSTFDSTMFKYIADIQNMTLFYQCNNFGQSNGLSTQACTLSDGAASQVYAAINPGYSAFGYCDHVVVIPILQSLTEYAMKDQIQSAIRSGFSLQWILDSEKCYNCTNSGGECGNDSEQFACYCKDGLHRSSCSDGNVINFQGEGSSTKLNGKIIIAICGTGIVIIIIALIVCSRKKCFRKRGTRRDDNVKKFMEGYGSSAPRRYTYSQVKRMTNSFANKLGEGGYGIVYKARLPLDGHPVAVKLLTESKGNGEEFINEVASIGRTSHVNIITLLGFCYEGDKRALIYEFMSNGSLDKFIYKTGSLDAMCNLEGKTMYQIAIGIARGLEYLHRGCNTRILHLDIKPQNILLDEDFCPKISDFGLAKICQQKKSIVSIIGTRGTIGFIAPEVFSRIFGGVSHKSDVYSYGMLVLEMVGRRKNYDNEELYTSEMHFPDWIYKDLEEGNSLTRNIYITYEENEIMRKMVLVSLWCIQTNPSDRPSMGKVVEMLEGPIESLRFPPKPFLYSPAKSPLQFSDESSSNMLDTIQESLRTSLEQSKD